MQEYVDKQQDRIAEDAVQMVAGCVANNVQNLLEAIRGKAIMALCQAEAPDATQAHMTQIVEFVDQGTRIVNYLTQFTLSLHKKVSR